MTKSHPTLAGEAHALSSGTMATLTGYADCSRLDDIQNRFALWCAGKADDYAAWPAAWAAYWRTDPAHPRASVTSLEALAHAIATASAKMQAQLDKETIEVETKTRLRPRKVQAEPVGLFAQKQLGIFSQ